MSSSRISWSPRIAAPVLLLVLACRDDKVASSLDFAAAASPPAAQAIGAAAGNARSEAAKQLTSVVLTSGRARAAMRPPVVAQTEPRTPSMIIRNGDVAVQVDSIEATIAAVRALATTLGGYIGNISLSTGEQQVRSATLEMKIPASRFDEAMTGMTPLGKVERSTAMAEEVGEEFVDVTARVANAKRLEERLVALLAKRTGKLEDVLAVERELARVREEIERYEGRIRFLSSRVAMSTITIAAHERFPIVSAHPGVNVISRAFVNMWRNAVRTVAAGIELLGLVIPVLAVAGILALAWKFWRRRSSRRLGDTEAPATA